MSIAPRARGVPRSTRPGMLVDALIYADERLLEDIVNDLSIDQAINVAMLPGIVGRSLAMPDIHQGYGFHPLLPFSCGNRLRSLRSGTPSENA